MYFNRSDICEAWYLYLSENHGGQGSRNYRRLSRLLSYFKPSILLSADRLSDNGREIYDALVDGRS